MKRSKKEVFKDKQILNIVMWGPSGAGKDWLIRGFIKETDDFNKNVGASNQGREVAYYYNVEQYGGLRVPTENMAVNHFSTANAESLELEFYREFRGKSQSPYYIKYYHHVVIHNNRGGEMVKVVASLSEDPAISTLFNPINNHFIVVLEPPGEETMVNRKVEEDKNDFQRILQGNTETGSPTFTRVEYCRSLKDFFNFLDQKGKKNIAICLSKADTHDKRGEPMQVLAQLYGEDLLVEVEKQQANHNIKVFLTTTEGFDKPNANSGGAFRNPTNTASPFFWFFEEAEKERLKKNAPAIFTGARLFPSNYVPYPQPE